MSFVNLRACAPCAIISLSRFSERESERGRREGKKLNLLLVAVDEDDGNHFHEGDHDEADGTGETVKHLQPVLASTGAENESHEKANETDDT